MIDELTRPIVGIENRTAQEVFDIMAARIQRSALSPGSTGETEGWRDIESDPPPMDGTVILLFCPQGDGSPGATFRVTAGNWVSDPGGIVVHRDLDGRYIDQDESDGWEGWISFDGGFSEETMMPTHWRPLPAPPSAMLSAAGGR